MWMAMPLLYTGAWRLAQRMSGEQGSSEEHTVPHLALANPGVYEDEDFTKY